MRTAMLSRRELLRRAGTAGLAVAALPLLQACKRRTKELTFLNWQDYIDPAVLTRFEGQTGIDITYQTYVSNDDLASKLVLANAARRRGREAHTFDLVVPSDNFVRRFVREDLLQTIDRAKLTNLGNLRPEFRSEGFDPGNRYTVPWATGSTGIGYDTSVFSEPPDWNVFADERFNGKMTILTEIRDAFAAALFSLGLDPNTTSAAEVDTARDQLITWKSVIRAFDSATYLDELASGQLVAAQAYSSDLLEAKARNPKLDFVIPAAGGGRWVDSLAIPSKAPDKDNAERFLDFYLRPEVSAEVANFVKVDTGNGAAEGLYDPAVRNDPIVFPPPDVLARLVFTADLGDAEKLYADAWKQVQSA